MSDLPAYPKCHSEYTYEDSELHICPECAYEWLRNDAPHAANNDLVAKDSNGNLL